MADAPPPSRREATAGRAYVGLAVLGGGLSILVGAVPHEDPLVGLALAAFGATLVATAPRLPAVGRLPPGIVATAGILLTLTLAANLAWGNGGLDGPKLALLALGVAL